MWISFGYPLPLNMPSRLSFRIVRELSWVSRFVGVGALARCYPPREPPVSCDTRDSMEAWLRQGDVCRAGSPSNLPEVVVPSHYPELVRILSEKSLKRGHFILASCRTSDY